MSTPFPSQEDGLALLATILAGHADATGAFCRAYLDPLAEYLERRFPNVPDDARQDVAENVLMALFACPTRYDPAKGELGPFLRMAAYGDLLNYINKERRRQGRLFPLVEHGVPPGYSLRDEPIRLLLAREGADTARAMLDRVRATLTAAEDAVLDLILLGVRRRAAFVEALGLGGQPPAEQRAAVKRAKDRLKKRIEREDDSHGGPGGEDGRTGAA